MNCKRIFLKTTSGISWSPVRPRTKRGKTIYLTKSALSAIVLREVAAFPHFCTAFKATMLTQTHVVYELYIRHVKTASPHGTICCFTWSCEKQQALDYKPFERFCLFSFVDLFIKGWMSIEHCQTTGPFKVSCWIQYLNCQRSLEMKHQFLYGSFSCRL